MGVAKWEQSGKGFVSEVELQNSKGCACAVDLYLKL